MSEAKHTPGPWRWEFNPDTKRLVLVGGKTRYDLKLLDFVRSGMQGGVARFRDPGFPELNVMELPNKWAVPEKGREHHAEWFKLIDHPDANLIAAAPDLLAACEFALAVLTSGPVDGCPELACASALRAAIAKATGAE